MRPQNHSNRRSGMRYPEAFQLQSRPAPFICAALGAPIPDSLCQRVYFISFVRIQTPFQLPNCPETVLQAILPCTSDISSLSAIWLCKADCIAFDKP
jgi:hypothetical protein